MTLQKDDELARAFRQRPAGDGPPLLFVKQIGDALGEDAFGPPFTCEPRPVFSLLNDARAVEQPSPERRDKRTDWRGDRHSFTTKAQRSHKEHNEETENSAEPTGSALVLFLFFVLFLALVLFFFVVFV